ncbi:MAG: MBL fold metallo-hydrolase [Candidatus Bathyarchaeota archaeon]|nr:MBL fold metallo-hydrolase [Candidatus Bathyarchaeota archaeon]
MRVKSFIVGLLASNCYVVNDLKFEAIIIDPGFETHKELEQITDYIYENSLKIRLIVNTHGHLDHISGNDLVQKKYECPICIHPKDAHFLGRLNEKYRIIHLKDGDFLDFGKDLLKVISTPGHTPGGISLVGENVVFTGDTLFSKGIGRMDFSGGSKEDMKKSLIKLMSLPEEYVVYSGHGVSTTIGEEKNYNPFLSWF